MTMIPTQGISTSNCSEPLFPVSCKRQEPTAKRGTTTAVLITKKRIGSRCRGRKKLAKLKSIAAAKN